jgi:hypothetical protein
MTWELRNIQTYPRLSEETTAFNASLYHGGNKVADIKNDGQGGCNVYYYTHGPGRAAFVTFIKGLPPICDWDSGDGPERDDIWCSKQLDRWEDAKWLRRNCKKHIVLRIPGKAYAEGEYSLYKNQGYTPERKEEILKEFGPEVVVYNEVSHEAAM